MRMALTMVILGFIKALLAFTLWIADLGFILAVIWSGLKLLFGHKDPIPQHSQFATVAPTNKNAMRQYSHMFSSLMQDPHATWVLDTNFLMNYASLIPQLQGVIILDRAVKRELDGIKEDKDSAGNLTERAKSSREATPALLDFQSKHDNRLHVHFNDDQSIYQTRRKPLAKAMGI